MNFKSSIMLALILSMVISCSSGSYTSDETLKTKQVSRNLNADFIAEKYGVRFTAPEHFTVEESVDSGEGCNITYFDHGKGGRFFVTLHRNFCGLNDGPKGVPWGGIKRCVLDQMELLKIKDKGIKSYEYNVYSAQAIYFNKGSFISPTAVFDKKYIANRSGQEHEFSSLGYAYKFNNSYYLVEIGFETVPESYFDNKRIFSELIKSIVYPR